MKEDFLHFVWRLRRFRQKGLQTTTGDAVEVLVPGQHNHNAGPDFLDARIRIGGTLWAGNVEMHLRSSQWLRAWSAGQLFPGALRTSSPCIGARACRSCAR